MFYFCIQDQIPHTSLFIHYSLIPKNIYHFKISSFLLLLYEIRNVFSISLIWIFDNRGIF
jgi:hypothetical protein